MKILIYMRQFLVFWLSISNYGGMALSIIGYCKKSQN
jgi:hypothetical protein